MHLLWSMNANLNFILFNIIFLLNLSTIFSLDPKIALVYMDGNGSWDSCRPGLKRSVNAESGLLISHNGYGTQPYNSSKNCFLTITVLLGFRIRIKVLDFDVNGEWNHCLKDTLHIFDHEKPLEASELERYSIDERSPGRILGQYCGKFPPTQINNQNDKSKLFKKNKYDNNVHILTESSSNALTLWWHTDERNDLVLKKNNFNTEGFRLLWSSFKVSENNNCNKNEFRCASGKECIPLTQGCNTYADCLDESDLNINLQIMHECKHIPTDFFSQLTGVKKLLICIIISFSLACVCFFLCARFYLCKSSATDNELQPKNFNQKQSECHLLGQNFSEKNKTKYIESNCDAKLLPLDLTQSHYNQKHYYKQYTNETLIPTILPHFAKETVCVNNTKQIESHPLPPKFSPPQIPYYRQLQSEQNEKNYKPNFSLSKQNFQHQKT